MGAAFNTRSDTADDRARGLAPAPVPLGAYRRAVVHDGHVWLSGMLPIRDGRPAWTGALGADLSIEDGMNAARLAAENAVAALHADLGSVAGVRVVRLGVFLRTSASFIDHARVADAASLRLRELLGSAGEHARLVFGVVSLPGGMPVELEVVCMRSGGAGRDGLRPGGGTVMASPEAHMREASRAEG